MNDFANELSVMDMLQIWTHEHMLIVHSFFYWEEWKMALMKKTRICKTRFLALLRTINSITCLPIQYHK